MAAWTTKDRIQCVYKLGKYSDVSRVWWTNFTHIFLYFQSLLVPYNY